MVNNHEQESPLFCPTYRQRLTQTGWIGAIFAMIMPIVASAFYFSYLGYVVSGHDDKMIVSGVCTLVASFAAMSGLIMILVGREYYQYIPSVREPKKEVNGYLA